MTALPLFRSITAEDVEELARLEALVEPTPWTAGDFADVLKNDWWGSVLTDEAGMILAWAVVMPVLDECELLTIGVIPNRQGEGLGRMMLNHAIYCAKKAGKICCHLEVRESNMRAIRLYETSGFARVGLRKNYYRTDMGRGREHAILMRADFSEADHA